MSVVLLELLNCIYLHLYATHVENSYRGFSCYIENYFVRLYFTSFETLCDAYC